MKQFRAGDTLELVESGEAIQLKVEDASKSEAISAKVLKSASPRYQEGMVYEFSRAQCAAQAE